MKCNLLFVSGQENYAETYPKALSVALKNRNHMFSTKSYKLQASVLVVSYLGRY